MLLLWVIFALMALLALWFVLPPLLQKNEEKQSDEPREANVLVYQDQYRELEADLRNGLIGEEQYQLDKSALERRLLEDTASTGDAASPSPHTGNARKLACVVGGGIPILAIAFYFVVGNPKALTPQASPAAILMAGSQSGQMTSQQIEANVANLARKLQQNPNDPQGWKMLARSYMILERFPDAATAYDRATALDGNNATLWADYAEALAMANGRRMAGKPLAAANRAVQIDPNNQRGLLLVGSAAFETGDYQKAIDSWKKLLALLPPGSDDAKVVSDQIDKAKELAAGRGSR